MAGRSPLTPRGERSRALRRTPLCYLLLFASLVLPSAAGCARPNATISSADGKVLARIDLEVADTGHKRELGLMYRDHLDPDAGMVFVMPEATHLVFWMKNTPLPLDMIFIGPDLTVVGVIANTTPFSEEHLEVPDAVSQYAIEVNAGFSKRHGITRGDRVRFANFSPVARN